MNFGIITGYSFKTNIKKESLVEFQIEQLLKNNTLSFHDGWSHLFAIQEYATWTSHNYWFRSFIYFDPFGIKVDPEPRTIVFFYQGKLFAIFHNKPIKYSGFSDQLEIRGGIMDYLPGFSRKITREFNEFYLKTISEAN